MGTITHFSEPHEEPRMAKQHISYSEGGTIAIGREEAVLPGEPKALTRKVPVSWQHRGKPTRLSGTPVDRDSPLPPPCPQTRV